MRALVLLSDCAARVAGLCCSCSFSWLNSKSLTLSCFEVVEEKPTVLFVLGGPGAGKVGLPLAALPLPLLLFFYFHALVLGLRTGCGWQGTMCTRLQESYGCVHLSAGDLLRAKRAEGGALGEQIDSFIKEGKIVPNEVTVKLIQEAMAASGSKIFLIDGAGQSCHCRRLSLAI